MKQLTEDEFDEQFTVVPGADGDTVRDDYKGIDPASRQLWTIVDTDGALYAVTGVHRVNRIGYIVTEEAWTEDTEAVWFIGEDDGDEPADGEDDGDEPADGEDDGDEPADGEDDGDEPADGEEDSA